MGLQMITLSKLSKKYGDSFALDSLSLNVPAGEIYAFLGMNGAGKTTTIRLMTGIISPTSGSVYINGSDISQDPIKVKSSFGYVPDRPHLYPKLTGLEYLFFLGNLYSVPFEVTKSRGLELLQNYGLIDVQDELIESYSHGMKQRLATCGALLHDPKVLILDEPMVGLDPQGALLLKRSLKQYANDGMTIFLSTHSLNIAEEIADRIGILHCGKLIASGSLSEIQNLVGSSSLPLEEMFLSLTT